jgi:hypothetical protein
MILSVLVLCTQVNMMFVIYALGYVKYSNLIYPGRFPTQTIYQTLLRLSNFAFL